MIPTAVPNLAGNEARYLQECVESTFVSSVGPFVDRFEELTAKATGAAHAVATSSGTTALHAALTAVGVGPGDLVLLPTYTFIASANSIAHCGAMPWLVDVSPESWTLDPVLMARTLAENTRREGTRLVHLPTGRRVAAVMPVHTLGLPADMTPIVDTARQLGLPVVADAAAAIGATYKGQALAQAGADLSVISFNGNKTVTAGGGGAIVGNDAALLQLARELTTTARRRPGYNHDRIAFNYRMTNLQAAVGCAQLERLDVLLAAKRRIRQAYDQAFEALPGVERLPSVAWAESSRWLSGFRFRPTRELSTETLRQHISGAGVACEPFWKPMHLQTPYLEAQHTETAVADGLWADVFVLPCSTGLTDAELRLCIQAVTSAFQGAADQRAVRQ